MSSSEHVRKPMKKTVTRLTLCAMLFALCASADAQQPKKVPADRVSIVAVPASY